MGLFWCLHAWSNITAKSRLLRNQCGKSSPRCMFTSHTGIGLPLYVCPDAVWSEDPLPYIKLLSWTSWPDIVCRTLGWILSMWPPSQENFQVGYCPWIPWPDCLQNPWPDSLWSPSPNTKNFNLDMVCSSNPSLDIVHRTLGWTLSAEPLASCLQYP